MRGVYLFGGLLLLIILQACREDDSYKPYPPAKDSTGNIAVALAGRVGTVVGENLTTYVKSLNLFLFRENTTGDYVLYRNMLLDKSQLEALTENTMSTQPGFTVPREFVFDSVPLANYKNRGSRECTGFLRQCLAECFFTGSDRRKYFKSGTGSGKVRRRSFPVVLGKFRCGSGGSYFRNESAGIVSLP